MLKINYIVKCYAKSPPPKKNKAMDKSMIQCVIFLHGHQTHLEEAEKNISVPGAELGGV